MSVSENDTGLPEVMRDNLTLDERTASLSREVAAACIAAGWSRDDWMLAFAWGEQFWTQLRGRKQ